MRLWLNTVLKVAAGTYFVVTSLYCLLAFLPYTFCAFIKTPPYAWMPWLAHHQAGLYWLAIGAALASGWPVQIRWKDTRTLLGIGLLAAGGVYVTLRPFLPGLQSNNAAYLWSLIALLPLVGIALEQSWSALREPREASERTAAPFGFSGGVLVALVVTVIYTIGAKVRVYSDTHTLGFHWQDVEVALWSLVSHVALAIAVLSAVNLIFLIAAKSPRSRVAAAGSGGDIGCGFAVGCAGTLSGQRDELRRMECIPLRERVRGHAHPVGVLGGRAIPGAENGGILTGDRNETVIRSSRRHLGRDGDRSRCSRSDRGG